MKAFLSWVVALLVLLGSIYLAFETGGISFLWGADVSKLTFVIAAVFAHSFGRLGRLLYQRYKGKAITDSDLDPGFESCDVSMALGMLGTVIGFIIMTSSFVSIDFVGVESVRQLFSVATAGISTALYTTAAGLIASILLRMSYYLTDRLAKDDAKKI